MKKKISILQIFRHVTQIAFFILLPGLFSLAFGQLKLIYTMILKGNFNFIQAFPKLIAVLAIFPITILFGRFFCGWFCAFGSFNDFLYLISSKVFKTKFKINKNLDVALKYLKYVILVFIVYVLWTKGNTLFDYSSPWDAFAQITDFPQAIADYFIGFVLLAFITAGALFIERFFCRYLCPLGAVFGVISKLRIIKIDKPTEKCGKCRICTNNCAMGINLYKTEKVRSGECINCFKCVEVCPRKNPEVSFMDENINPKLASSIAIVAFAGLYAGSGALGSVISDYTKASANKSGITNSSTANKGDSVTSKDNSTPPPTAIPALTSKPAPTTANSKYKNGTYTGSGTGYRGNLIVSVSVKNDKITMVKVVSIKDDYQEPVNTVPQEIVQAQSTSVDAVSGATHTSDGIMSAVKDALSKAMM